MPSDSENHKIRIMKKVCERAYEKPATEDCHRLERVFEIQGGGYPKLSKSLSFNMVSPRPPMNDGRGHKAPPEPSETSLKEDKKRVTQMLWRVGTCGDSRSSNQEVWKRSVSDGNKENHLCFSIDCLCWCIVVWGFTWTWVGRSPTGRFTQNRRSSPPRMCAIFKGRIMCYNYFRHSVGGLQMNRVYHIYSKNEVSISFSRKRRV